MFGSYSSHGGFYPHSHHSSATHGGGMLYGLSLDPRCQHNEQARLQNVSAQMRYNEHVNAKRYYNAAIYNADLALPDPPKRESVILSPHPYEYGGTVPEADERRDSTILGWLLTAVLVMGLIYLGVYAYQTVTATKVAAVLNVEPTK